jgi:hypothetical protein
VAKGDFGRFNRNCRIIVASAIPTSYKVLSIEVHIRLAPSKCQLLFLVVAGLLFIVVLTVFSALFPTTPIHFRGLDYLDTSNPNVMQYYHMQSYKCYIFGLCRPLKYFLAEPQAQNPAKTSNLARLWLSILDPPTPTPPPCYVDCREAARPTHELPFG